MVVRDRVFADALIVDGLRSELRVRVLVYDGAVKLFGVRPVLFRQCEPSQPHLQMREKLVFWKVSFQPASLLSFGIQDQDRRCPECIETAEVLGILLDMNFERNEVLFDE